MLVLGIETSCADTSFALVEDGYKILALRTASQEKIHAEYGGVFPEMAARAHEKAFIPLLERALESAKVTLNQIDLIAVTQGPGLIGSLHVGVEGAKALSFALNKPLVAVNHVEAHLYAAYMTKNVEAQAIWPALGIVLSGGHTSVYFMEHAASYTLISETVDDALGEAFDKCAKMLHLPYPGGPHIEKMAKEGDPHAYPLKAGFVKERPLYFSFSGLKTAVKYVINSLGGVENLNEQQKKDLCASFQQTAFKDVLSKCKKLAQLHGCKSWIVGGGVTMNQALRKCVENDSGGALILFPEKELCQDNAAMIAGLGFHKYVENKKSAQLTLCAAPRLAIHHD
jgi:N6-L-threonylcarbamoyladenine synthase